MRREKKSDNGISTPNGAYHVYNERISTAVKDLEAYLVAVRHPWIKRCQ